MNMRAGYVYNDSGWWAVLPDPDVDNQVRVHSRYDTALECGLFLSSWMRRN